MKKLTLAAIILAVSLLLTSSAAAEDHHFSVVAAGSVQLYNDFHLTVSVDTIYNVRILRDPGVNATIEITGYGTGVCTLYVEWDSLYTAANFEIEILFSAEVEDLGAVEAQWSIDGALQGIVAYNVSTWPIDPLPSLTEYGIIGLAVLIALSGLWMYRRRRVRTPA